LALEYLKGEEEYGRSRAEFQGPKMVS